MKYKEYQKVNLFPVRCFSFKAPDSLVSDALEKSKVLQYKSFNDPAGVGTSDDIQSHKDFKPLMEWFQECIDSLHVDEGWNCDRLVVNKAWVNRSDAKSGHHHEAHRHPMSYLSGVFYMTEGPPTIFLDPLQQREWAQFHLDGTTVTDSRAYITSLPGGLFLFPSYMIHASVENDGPVDRYTIAFNTFPYGQINTGGWYRPMVSIPNRFGPLPLNDYTNESPRN